MVGRFFDKKLRKFRFLKETKYSRCLSLKTNDGQTRKLFHRGTTADRSVLKGIFLKEHYSLKPLGRGHELLALYNDIVSSGRVPLIIDAGANLGGSAVWFADHFNKAHIIAIEPDPENVEYLKKNTIGLNVEVHQAAIGSTDGTVFLFDAGNGACGFQTEERENGNCRRISMSRIFQEKTEAGYVPFIVKIDIEGGEENLFEQSVEWMETCPLIIIELHDWLFLGAGKSANFLKAISKQDRDFVHIGENIFSIRN